MGKDAGNFEVFPENSGGSVLQNIGNSSGLRSKINGELLIERLLVKAMMKRDHIEN
jgi:hypothetical protein